MLYEVAGILRKRAGASGDLRGEEVDYKIFTLFASTPGEARDHVLLSENKTFEDMAREDGYEGTVYLDDYIVEVLVRPFK